MALARGRAAAEQAAADTAKQQYEDGQTAWVAMRADITRSTGWPS